MIDILLYREEVDSDEAVNSDKLEKFTYAIFDWKKNLTDTSIIDLI